MRKSGIALIAFAAVVALYRARPRVEHNSPTTVEEVTQASRAAPTLEKAAPAVTSAVSIKAEVDLKSLPGRADLARHHALAAKVFTTGPESAERTRLLHDPKLLRAAGARLVLKLAPGSGVGAEQDQALALLIDSVRTGEPAATAALTAVVKDPGVEDARLDSEVRQQLAGLKAEALYAWSSLDPSLGQRVGAWLPGPVSQKLWQNVVSRQQSNVASSLDLKNGEKLPQ